MTSAPPTTPDDPRVVETMRRIADGAALQGLDLNGVTFTGAEIGGPLDFTGVDLRGATFVNLDLTGACFAEADISGATFHNATLARARFDRCSGRGAVFTDVNLAYASFAKADLRGALFFDANMADISFKGASLDGSEVDAIRLSLNGSTHTLGLKEALRTLNVDVSYPYIAGVSGDSFWISYYLKTGDLHWGGLIRAALQRGLGNFGYPCSFLDEVEVDDAWDALKDALADGATVITPLHVSAATVLGAGFGGAEWVFVSGIDRGDVLVNCLLGDGLRFSPERFKRGWCQHHPLEEAAEDLPVIYAMCVVGERERTPSRAEITRAGIRAAVEVLTLPSTEKVVFGFDAYTQLVHDLESAERPQDLPPDEVRRFLPWLGLGILHHHGSRWAIRDFLDEVLERGDFTGDDREAVVEARALYAETCSDLQRFLEVMPWTFDTADERERDAAVRRYHERRNEGADLLRAAAARERDALERFRALGAI